MLKSATWLASSLIALTVGMAQAEDMTMDTVVASVNGTDITLGQMIISRAQLPAQYQDLEADVLFKGILDQLIQQQLLSEQITDMPRRVAIALENERRSMMAGEVIQEITDSAVTDDALQAAYDARFAGAEPEMEWNASHILVASREEIDAIKARVDAGEDFAALASELSTDTSGPGGGSLGWFGKGMMVEPFEVAVMTLEAGQVSTPVETQFGWHLVMLNETRNKVQPTLDEVRAELSGELEQNAILAKIAELEGAATITRPEEGAFDPTILQNLDLLEK